MTFTHIVLNIIHDFYNDSKYEITKSDDIEKDLIMSLSSSN